ncbi:histidinol-phosphate aminotransferase, chloroplastic [Olea europaea subsp. europaea]|uniref:histidinol-phosphate transaminase n=1 Tax=Olea europaea subsp. europaea TaxID=158383 RepID=A0A8S0P8V0_OLEEU|nr:histidinol-phosphate aminotransferase, chloroplastic [Olea europaea subsp. europaea]
MAAIDLFCNPSSLCIDRPSLRVGSSCFSVEGKLRRSGIAYMASSVPIKEESRENLGCSVTGDSFIRPHLRKLSPYQPILPFEVLSTRLGRKPEDIVKLDANENPYGPPPEVLEALGSMRFPYIYPDPESRSLRAALAEDSGIESEYILAGCGADELIDLIMRCVLDPGDKIVDCPPTFTMYEFDAAVNAARVIKVSRKLDFSLDVEQIAEVVEQERPKCIFLTSPNNPDGSIINDETLLKILTLPVLVVLDEAYIEFSGIESRMSWVKKYENLIVLRTFSKRAGLAGIRVGYGAFPFSIIEYLWRAKQPYNVSVAAEISACAALTNPVYLEVQEQTLVWQLASYLMTLRVKVAIFDLECQYLLRNLFQNVKVALVLERERLFKLLKEVPFLNPYPSYSNFILCEVTSGMDAKKLKEDLAKMGIMIRHYNNKELSGYVRVSVGKPEHTDALMLCLKRLG